MDWGQTELGLNYFLLPSRLAVSQIDYIIQVRAHSIQVLIMKFTRDGVT
jgi:hypothetical protein